MSDARRHTLFVQRFATLSLNLGNNQLFYIPLVPFLSADLICWNRKKIFSKLRTSALPASTAFMISAVPMLLGLRLLYPLLFVLLPSEAKNVDSGVPL